MKVLEIATGKTLEVDNAYGARLIAHGKAKVIPPKAKEPEKAPEETKEPETGETAPAPSPAPAAKPGKKK